MKKKRWMLLLCLLAALFASACAADKPGPAISPTPGTETSREGFSLPDEIRVNAAGVPQLRVYVTDDKEIHEMDLEEYLCGVVAGEMKNDWPQEALRAQAILARTFVIKFLTEKQSRYQGADISTDIEEAQAYDAQGINDNVRQAVEATRGQIVCYRGEPIYAWFHAHAGGRTATAEEGLSYRKAAPYTQSVESAESDQAPAEDSQWQAQFTESQVIAAAADVGIKLGDSVTSVKKGSLGESGRLNSLVINGKEVQANELRIALGSTEMKSTYITELTWRDGILTLSGKGYGHGVGMSQWGAYALAEQGKHAADIINMYFRDVEIVQAWK